jgi:hypothetical protein
MFMSGIIAIVLIIIIGYFILNHLSENSELKDLKLTTINNLVLKNLCKIRGEIICNKQIKSPLSKKNCACYF